MKRLFEAVTTVLLIFATLLTDARAEKDYAAYLETAATSRKQVEQAEAKLERSLDKLFVKLDAAILSIQPADLVGERLAIAELRELVPKLRAEAESIIAAHQAYQQAATDYGEQLTEARPIVYEAATAFQEFAAAEPYEDLQEQYRLVAESFLAINTKYEHLQSQVAPSLAAVSKNLDYTQHTTEFLQRLEKFLVVMPKDSPSLERFLSNLAAYVEHFERLRGQLKNFHQATTEGLEGNTSPQLPSSRPQVTKLQQRAVVRKTPASLLNLSTPTESLPAATSRVRSIVPADDDPFGESEDMEDDPFDEPALWQLSGLWRVGHDGTTLRFDQRGKTVTVSLSRSPRLKKVVGKIRMEGSRLHVDRLRYYLNGGKTVNLAGATWQVQTEDYIAASGPTFQRDTEGNYFATGLVHTFPLRRR